MAKERPEGIQEQMLQCMQNMETHLGIIAKNPQLGVTVTNQDSAATPRLPKAEPAKPKAETAQAPVAEVPTADQVRLVLKEYAENFGREAAIKLLSDQKYKNAGSVPAEKRAEFIAYVNSN